MNTVTQITPDASATPGYRPLNTSRWTRDRDLFRDACVERSRAGFLAMRLLALRDEDADDAARSAELLHDTRAELQGIVVRYASLLLRLGEPPSTVLSLVDELATALAAHAAWTSIRHLEELRADLLQWAIEASQPVYTGELRSERRASSMARNTETSMPDGSASTENIRATP